MNDTFVYLIMALLAFHTGQAAAVKSKSHINPKLKAELKEMNLQQTRCDRMSFKWQLYTQAHALLYTVLSSASVRM